MAIPTTLPATAIASPRAIRPGGVLLAAGIPCALNALACGVAIPALDATEALPIEVSYFLAVGLLVLAPMFFVALHLGAAEAPTRRWRDVLGRLRIRAVRGEDWAWMILTFLALAGTSFLVARVFMPAWGMDPTPFFLRNVPLDAEHRWILVAWLPFFFFNVLGEELYWRGFLQPRQEVVHGSWTWLVQGVLWGAWHLPMGVNVVVAALPVFFVLPALAQIRRSTTLPLAVHAAFGAFGFLALALGWGG